jgi:hypothetical protein
MTDIFDTWCMSNKWMLTHCRSKLNGILVHRQQSSNVINLCNINVINLCNIKSQRKMHSAKFSQFALISILMLIHTSYNLYVMSAHKTDEPSTAREVCMIDHNVKPTTVVTNHSYIRKNKMLQIWHPRWTVQFSIRVC